MVNGAVISAAIAGWMFGAVWYGIFSKQWMKASNLTLNKIDPNDKTPYILSLLGCFGTALVLQILFQRAGITDVQDAAKNGLLVGFGVVFPWTLNNVMYSMRNKKLIYIDGGYACFGTAVIATTLAAYSTYF